MLNINIPQLPSLHPSKPKIQITGIRTVQLIRAARARHNSFFISHVCKLVCAHKIGNVKPAVQSSHVRNRRVQDACVHV